MERHHIETQAVRTFTIKLIKKLIVMLAVISTVYVITETPILTNQVAMGQMGNSNDWFVVMTAYQKFVNVASWFRNIVVLGILSWIGYDGYSLAKSLNT